MYASRWNQFFDAPEPDKKVILNLLGGSMDLIDHEMVQLLRTIQEKGSVDITDKNRPVVTDLFNRGYIFNSREEEEEKLMQFLKVWNETIRQKVESITVYPTFLCNLRCVYCFECQDMKGKADVMTKEVLDAMMRSIDTIHEIHGSNENAVVTIFGGEPLLKRSSQINLIKELLKALKKRNFFIGIITNGVELPYYSEILSQHGVETVEVTVDGPKEIHDKRRVFPDGRGSFDKVVEGIDAAIASRIHTVVRVNVDMQNMQSLPDLADFIIAKGWIDKGVELNLYPIDLPSSECATRCSPVDPEMLSKTLDMFESEKKTKIFTLVHRIVKLFEDLLYCRRLPFAQLCYCGATAGNKYSFDLYGKIFGCCCMNCCDMEELRIGEFYPELRFDESTRKLWQKRTILNLPKCQNCQEALLCGSGCTRAALALGGSLEDDIFCSPIREEFQTVLNHYYPKFKDRVLA